MSKGDGLNPYLYAAANPVNAIDPDGLCALRMVGGIADIGAGLLLTAKTGGVGLVVAWGLIINGADNLVAGAYSMIAGEEIPSLIQSGFRRAIPNRTAADLAYMGFEIGLNVAGLAVERAAQRAAAQVAGELTEEASENILGKLQKVGPDTWESAAGLQYGPDPRFGNRVRHVLRHAVDNPARSGPHGVFDAGRKGILRVIDEAWEIAKHGGPNVIVTPQGARMVYTVNMGRRIGYVGGRLGSTIGNPAAQHIQIVIENASDLITAFPIIP